MAAVAPSVIAEPAPPTRRWDRGPRPASVLHHLLQPMDGTVDGRVWGLPPDAFVATPTGVLRALRQAGCRELAILGARVRPPRPHARRRIHRWPAPGQRGGTVGRVLRVATDGVVLQVGGHPGSHALLDVLLADAGVANGHVRLRPTRGGGVVAAVKVRGVRAMLRVGTSGASSDPTVGYRALEVLDGQRVGLIPRPLRHGARDGLRWTLERWLPGRVGVPLDQDQVDLLGAVWAGMPAADGPATAEVGDLLRIALLVPSQTRALRRMMAAVGPPRLPGVLRHGDLWSGNVLVDRGAVAGVVDWGSWSPAGTPGADLLHLVALLHRRRGESLGALWCREPWTWPAFRRLVGPALSAQDVAVTPEVLEHIGVAWWATAVAGTLDRLPHRAYDDGWVHDNVTSVLQAW